MSLSEWVRGRAAGGTLGFDTYNRAHPEAAVRPFNFVSAAYLKPLSREEPVRLFAPFVSEPAKALESEWYEHNTGRRVAITTECHETAPRGGRLRLVTNGATRGGPMDMLHAGLDLSRKRLDYHLLNRDGETIEVGAAPPDADGLESLARRLARHERPVRAAIESMNGARFVHDRLELSGFEVEIADAQKVKGLAPLACKTDKIDAWVLAELSRRELVPAIWLPTPGVAGKAARPAAAAVLAQLRKEGRDPAHGGEAAMRRGSKNAGHQRALREWVANDAIAEDPARFRNEIRPALTTIRPASSRSLRASLRTTVR